MAVLSKEFPLDPAILGPGSAATVSVSGATNPATLAAIAGNTPFPAAVDLGRISLGAGSGQGIRFAAGGAAVNFTSGAAMESGIGIFDAPGEALKSLGLEQANAIDLKLPAMDRRRWAIMRWRYDVTGTISATHPLGAIGAATLGVDARHEAAYAVLHAFDTAAGAQDVLAATVTSWRLPRHVNLENGEINIKPLTWIVGEADGSLALDLAARLGYDISYTHELAVLGVTRDLGAKIDANLKATLGLNVEGRYVIVVGRESPDRASHVVRLRLYKQSKQGLSFGLNLNVGVKAVSPFPRDFDDFVRVVFGVHGPQVLRDLHVIEQWTDPSKDLAETAARLTTRTGLELLQQATGLDLPARFHEARQVVVDALNHWDRLPDRVSAVVWGYLSRSTPDDVIAVFRRFLGALAGPDLAKRRDALMAALQEAPVADSPVAAWLQAVAGHALVALGDDLDRLAQLARETLAVLDGGTIQKLQQFVTSKLDLAPLRRAITDDDFNALDEWLVRRLADLLNRPELHLADLKEVQRAIFAVDSKVRDLYAQGLKALTKRYTGDVATTYERTRGETALLDVSFDLDVASAHERFRAVADAGGFEDLLLRPVDGVRLHDAALSHAIGRQAHVEVRLPFVTAETSHVTESLAKLSVEEQAGRVLLYEFDATDTVTTANRARSELSVLGAFRAQATHGAVPPEPPGGTIAYEGRQVQRGMHADDLEERTRPFIDAYLGALFPNPEVTVPAFFGSMPPAAGGVRAVLGDVAIASEVSYPARVLQGWLLPRDEQALQQDTMRLSRAIQASVKRLLPRTYLDDLDHLRAIPPVAALLVWSSLPISTSIDLHGPAIQFNTDRDVFWDYVSRDDRRAVARDSHTVRALRDRLGEAYRRLLAAGRGDANAFRPDEAGRLIDLALEDGGDLYLLSLLTAEALMVGGAVRALRRIAEAVRQSRTAPAAAVRALSEFAASLVETFGGRLQFVYTGEAVRTLGPMMLAESSAALHPASETLLPCAALRLYVLKSGHAFKLDDFVKGELPSSDNVAIAETLVRA